MVDSGWWMRDSLWKCRMDFIINSVGDVGIVLAHFIDGRR